MATTKQGKPHKRRGKLPVGAGGSRTTDAERNERIRIVESLIVAGRGGSIEELQFGLEKSGREKLPSTTVRGYMKIAKERLTREDDSTRTARREIMVRALLSDAAIISRKLEEAGVEPRWSDRIACLKLLDDVLEKATPIVGPVMPDDDTEDLTDKTPEQLDKMIAELAEKAGGFSSLLPKPDKPEA